jgi:hypothetical protein
LEDSVTQQTSIEPFLGWALCGLELVPLSPVAERPGCISPPPLPRWMLHTLLPSSVFIPHGGFFL